MASEAGAIAAGIQGGWGMGLQSDELALRRQQVQAENERASRALDIQQQQNVAQQGLAQQHFGLQQAQAGIAALGEQRDMWLKAATAASSRGERVDPAWLAEASRLTDQMSGLQQQLAGGPGAANAAPVAATPAAPAPVAPGASPTQIPAPAEGLLGGIAAQQGAPAPAAAAARGVGTGPSDEPAVASPAAAAPMQTPEQRHVADVEQRVKDISSRLQTGQLSLDEVDPKDLAMMVAVATKRPPSDIKAVQQGISDWQAGMATGNNGLVVQGLNTIYGPQIQQGVGQPSAHGGTIVKKEIIGLDPAVDANGVQHPDKVIPRLRITTDIKGPDGQPLTYDAPMTLNRSTDPNDPVRALSVQEGADNVGRLGTLVAALGHPDIAAAAARGEQQAKPQINNYLSAFNALTAPTNPGLVKEQQLTGYMKAMGLDPANADDRAKAEDHLVTLGILPYHAPKGAEATYGVAQQMVADGAAPDIPTALRTLQAAGVTKQPTRFSAGAVDHAISKYNPSGNGVGGAAGTAGAAAPPPPPPAGTVNPITGSAVLPAPDKRGLILGLTPGAIDREAFTFIDTNKTSAFGRGNDNAAVQKILRNRADELLTRAGIPPESYAGGNADYKANAKSLALQQTRADAIDLSMDKVKRDIGTLQDAIKPGNLDFQPWLNKPINAVRAAVGSGPLASYTLALKQVATEYERLLNGGQLSVAQLHVGAQKDAAEILNGSMNIEQVNAVLPTMLREMNNAQSATHSELSAIQGRMRQGVGGSGVKAPAASGVAAWSAADEARLKELEAKQNAPH